MLPELKQLPPVTPARPGHSLFFAIMAPRPVAETIGPVFDRFRRRYCLRKRHIPGNRLHVSLVAMYAGETLPEIIVQTSMKTGDALRFVEFDLVLDRALSFRNQQAEKPFVLAASKDTSSAANRLVREIQHTFLMLTSTRLGRHRAITPHMTLSWERLLVPEQAIDPIKMPVREFGLVHSYIGQSRYEILKTWQLVPIQ